MRNIDKVKLPAMLGITDFAGHSFHPSRIWATGFVGSPEISGGGPVAFFDLMDEWRRTGGVGGLKLLG
jgi:hypothetical protein